MSYDDFDPITSRDLARIRRDHTDESGRFWGEDEPEADPKRGGWGRFASLAVVAVAVAGCSQVRTLNEGAAGPWRVEESPAAQTHADYAGPMSPTRQVIGWCDHERRIIRLSSDRPRVESIAVSWHELGHRLERDYPAVWVHLDAMDAPGFPCGSDELHAEQRALAEARRATEAAK